MSLKEEEEEDLRKKNKNKFSPPLRALSLKSFLKLTKGGVFEH